MITLACVVYVAECLHTTFCIPHMTCHLSGVQHTYDNRDCLFHNLKPAAHYEMLLSRLAAVAAGGIFVGEARLWTLGCG